MSPGILAVFLLGLFWKRATNKAAIWGAILSVPVALYLKVGSKEWLDDTFLEVIFPKMAFMNQMGVATIISMIIVVIISYIRSGGAVDAKAIPLSRELFSTGKAFNISALIIIAILIILYSVFW